MMETNKMKDIGVAVIGAGGIGTLRAHSCKQIPQVNFLAVCDVVPEKLDKLAKSAKADLATSDLRKAISDDRVGAVIVSTDEENHHEAAALAAELGKPVLIEKPFVLTLDEADDIIAKASGNGAGVFIGYTQRFRRRFLAVKQRVDSGQIGEPVSAVTRAFMNRMTPAGELRNATPEQKRWMTPMVISGTHSLDACMWILNDPKPVSVYAKATDKILGPLGTKDSTFGVWTFEGGAIWSMNISWGLPAYWPGSVYGLEIGIVGTEGVIDIDDTHRDLVLASHHPQGAGYKPEGLKVETERHVDFLTSFPPGDLYGGELWGPMRDETNTWFQRIYHNKPTPHATAEEGHRNLIMTMAMDLSAKRGKEVQMPVSAEELMAG